MLLRIYKITIVFDIANRSKKLLILTKRQKMSFYKDQALQKNFTLSLLPLVVFLVYLALGIWKIFPALSQPDALLVPGGDGHSLIAEIYDISERFQNHGFRELLGDVFVSDRWGDPKLYGDFPVINFFWRSTFVFLSQFFSPQNVYDVIGVLGYAFSGLCGYLLALRIGLNSFWAALFPSFLLLMPNTELRLQGHLLLAFLHAPMLFLAWTIDAARHPSGRHYILAAIGLWLSFVVNEYYGYFSLWVGGALFIALRWHELGKNFHSEVKSIADKSKYAFLVFAILMCFTYPSVLLGGLARKLGLDTGLPEARKFVALAEFEHYGLKNPLRLVQPSFEFPNWSFLKYFATPDSPEFTFRIGIVIPLFVFLSWLWLSKKKFLEFLPERKTLTALFFASLVALALALHPQYMLLVWITKSVAPMFRVGARALFLFDALVLLMFFLTLQGVWRATAEASKSLFKSYVIRALLVFICCLGLRDLSTEWLTITRQHVSYSLPVEVALARTMKELEDGLVLELPIPSRAAGDVFEDLYPSKLNTIFHGKKSINFMWSQKYESNANAFAIEANQPTRATIQAFRDLGIRYLKIAKKSGMESTLSQFDEVKLLVSSDVGSVFEIIGVRSDWSFDRFVAYTNALLVRKK